MSDLGVSIEDNAFNKDGTPYKTAFALVMPLAKRDDVGLWWARYDTYRDEWIRHHQE
jgi:DNA mismatch repair protein MutH